MITNKQLLEIARNSYDFKNGTTYFTLVDYLIDHFFIIAHDLGIDIHDLYYFATEADYDIASPSIFYDYHEIIEKITDRINNKSFFVRIKWKESKTHTDGKQKDLTIEEVFPNTIYVTADEK